MTTLKNNTNRVLCILGMHRSGTSCLTGCLEEAGLLLGNVITQAPHNKKGNRENLNIMDLHEQILRDNGLSWDTPSGSLEWSSVHQLLRDKIIETYPANKLWGFKDPRTLLTLDGWVEAIPTLELVGTYRHPISVAKSLQARNGFSFERSFNIWFAYNQLLLKYYNQFKFPIVSFDLSRGAYHEKLEYIVDILDLQLPKNGFSFFENSLINNDVNEDETELPRNVTDLYQRLGQVALA